jgi:cytochrome P450
VKSRSQFFRSQAHKIAPGPSIHPNFWEDPLKSFTNLAHEYGDVVCLDPNTHQIYLVNHPNDIKHVLQDNYRNYRKDADSFKLIIGEGLAVSEGDFWLRQRRMMQPAFHRQSVAAMLPLITDATTQLLKRWQIIAEHDETIDILTEMTELTINISVSTMFGADIKDEIQPLAQALKTAQEYVYYHGWDYEEKLEKQPSSEKIQFQEAINTIDRIVYRIINERRQNKQSRDDLLAMLLHASDQETGNGMSEKQLRDEAVTMLGGGQGTTAIALTWIWYMLSTHPEVENRLYTELVEVLGQSSPTFQDLPNLVYTRMIVDEVLRIYPPAWLIVRQSLGEDVIGGYHIPKNSEIFISPHLVHRNSTFWEDPERFDPERFSPGRSAGRPQFAYLPFSAGPHVCIGNNFAIMTIQVILTMVTQFYRLHLISEQPIQPQAQILLQPQDSILMRLQKRY